jgi:hypothetical protein
MIRARGSNGWGKYEVVVLMRSLVLELQRREEPLLSSILKKKKKKSGKKMRLWT